ncbi:MAG: flippase-like domain-containing protein [Bacteroidetes bacterium]|nr:flippase-like domain-containing protein [Bacteroidota bacterium]
MFKNFIQKYFKPLIWGLKIFTLAGLISVCFFINWNEVFRLGHRADSSYLILAGLLVIPNIFFSWLKWDYVVRFIDSRVRKRVTFYSMLSGLALDTVTLSPIGDYAGRLLNMSAFPKASLVALHFIEKISLLFISCIAGSIAFIVIAWNYIPGAVEKELIMGLGIFFLLFGIAGIFFCATPKPFLKLIPKFKFIGQFHLDGATLAAQRLNAGDNIYLIFVNVLKYFTYITQFYLIILAFGSLPISIGYLGATATLLVRSVLSGLTFGDLGIREISSVYFFTKFGLSAEIALFSALLLFIINRLTPSVIGILIIMAMEIKPTSLSKQVRFMKIQRIRKRHSAKLKISDKPVAEPVE